jgi:hypothetical protein
MGKMNLNLWEERTEFADEFLPPGMGFEWRFAEPNELLPLHAPTPTCFGAYVGYFREGGLRLPLDPLFLELMKSTQLPFNCLGLNLVQVVSSISAFNKRYDAHLGLREVWYCSMLIGRNHSYYFSPYKPSPELIKGLPTSGKDASSRLIVVTRGPVLPEGFEDFVFPCFTEKISKCLFSSPPYMFWDC